MRIIIQEAVQQVLVSSQQETSAAATDVCNFNIFDLSWGFALREWFNGISHDILNDVFRSTINAPGFADFRLLLDVGAMTRS